MQHDKFWQTGRSVSEEPAASIFRVENKMEATHASNRLFSKSSFNAHLMFLQTATHSKIKWNIIRIPESLAVEPTISCEHENGILEFRQNSLNIWS